MISIRTKTLGLLFASIMLCSIFTSSITIYITYSNLKSQVKQKLSLLTDNIVKEISLDNLPIQTAVDDLSNIFIANFDTQQALNNPKTYLPAFLDSIDLQVKEITQNTKEAIGGYIYPNVETYKDVYNIWYILENGRFFKTNKIETLDMFNPKDDSLTWYYAPIQNKKGLWTHVYFDDILKENDISYVKPIIINNIVVGVAGMDASFEEKKKVVESIKIYDTGSAFLIDDKRQYIVPPKSNVVISKDELEKIFQQLEKTTVGSFENKDSYFNFVKMENNQILVTVAPKKEVIDPINQIIIWIVSLTVIITILVMFIGYKVSKNIIDPLEKLIEFAGKLGNGQMEESVDVKTNDEVGNLAVSFDKLRLSIIQQNQKLSEYWQDLEVKVKERTKELIDKNNELEKINRITLDRELKMIELKEQIKKLEEKQNTS